MVEGLKKILIKINRLPVPFTIKHYFAFGGVTDLLKDKKLDSRESWDVLRSSHPHFSVLDNREDWLKACGLETTKDGQDSNLIKRAEDIVKILDDLKIKSVFSVGVGGAALEYHIKRLRPEIELTCSEYSEINVCRLKKVFKECDSIVFFDMMSKDWTAALRSNEEERYLCLIYRVDASFTDEQWRNVFQAMFSSGIQNILYIPTNFLTILSFFIRLRQRLLWKIKGQSISFAGYLRTKKTFQNYWRSLYAEKEKNFGGLDGFLLKKINKDTNL